MILPLTVKEKIVELMNSHNDKMVKIISLHGEHGAGKDVYARAISELYDDVYIIRFADPLRRAFCKDLNLSSGQLDMMKRLPSVVLSAGSEVDSVAVGGLTMREALIKVANVNKHRYGEYYYANLWMDEFNKILQFFELRAAQQLTADGTINHLTILVPDLRFECERETLKKLDAVTDFLEIHIPRDLPTLTGGE